MPQYAVLIYAPSSPHTPDATPEDLATCDAHAEELGASAVMTSAWALMPRETARSVRPSGVTDGPFVDTREVVVGFYIVEAPDLDAAVATAATNPVLREGGGLEVRQVHSGGWVDTRGR